MSWQIYALLATLAVCFEGILDKRAMRVCEVDSDVATFIRVAGYCLIIVPLGYALGQTMTVYLSWGVLVFGCTGALKAMIYTRLVKTVDITTLSVLSYIGPLIFMVIDQSQGHGLMPTQMVGIVGLVLGGIGFSLDGKLSFDRKTLGVLAVMIGLSGGEAYYLKFLMDVEGLSGLAAYANIWGWASVMLAGGLVVRKKWPLLRERDSWKYIRYSVFAKSFDAANSVGIAAALSLATVAQVSSMEVFYPPMMLIVALVAQKVFCVDLGESVHRAVVVRKTAMAGLLMASGMMV